MLSFVNTRSLSFFSLLSSGLLLFPLCYSSHSFGLAYPLEKRSLGSEQPKRLVKNKMRLQRSLEMELKFLTAPLEVAIEVGNGLCFMKWKQSELCQKNPRTSTLPF